MSFKELWIPIIRCWRASSARPSFPPSLPRYSLPPSPSTTSRATRSSTLMPISSYPSTRGWRRGSFLFRQVQRGVSGNQQHWLARKRKENFHLVYRCLLLLQSSWTQPNRTTFLLLSLRRNGASSPLSSSTRTPCSLNSKPAPSKDLKNALSGQNRRTPSSKNSLGTAHPIKENWHEKVERHLQTDVFLVNFRVLQNVKAVSGTVVQPSRQKC